MWVTPSDSQRKIFHFLFPFSFWRLIVWHTKINSHRSRSDTEIGTLTSISVDLSLASNGLGRFIINFFCHHDQISLQAEPSDEVLRFIFSTSDAQSKLYRIFFLLSLSCFLLACQTRQDKSLPSVFLSFLFFFLPKFSVRRTNTNLLPPCTFQIEHGLARSLIKLHVGVRSIWGMEINLLSIQWR